MLEQTPRNDPAAAVVLPMEEPAQGHRHCSPHWASPVAGTGLEEPRESCLAQGKRSWRVLAAAQLLCSTACPRASRLDAAIRGVQAGKTSAALGA